MSKVITGRGKINFSGDKDREKMKKKYPDVEFEKMNPLTFTTTYKGNGMFDLKIKVGDTIIPCSFKRWAMPWKYGSKLELIIVPAVLKKKTAIHITGGIQGKLFQFFRYDYEKMLGKKKGGGKKYSFTTKYTKISKIDCAKKNPKSREKTLKCLDDKKEQFKSLGKDSPKDMKELQNTKKGYQKSIKKLMEKMTKDCMKYHGDEKKLQKCAEKEKKELESYGKDIPKIVMDDMRDNIQRMIDHTQKVDLGMFSDSKKK